MIAAKTETVDLISKDFTPSGLKLEGAYENDRNCQNRTLYADIIREVYNAEQSIIAHHLTYVAIEHRDGFEYQIVEEIPAADTLIFDHDAARKLWGNGWREILVRLALTPVPERDLVLAELFYGRAK